MHCNLATKKSMHESNGERLYQGAFPLLRVGVVNLVLQNLEASIFWRIMLRKGHGCLQKAPEERMGSLRRERDMRSSSFILDWKEDK